MLNPARITKHLEKVRYFYMIAETRSLHVAARKLAISPPALSVSIKQLEAALGTTLFDRSPTGMSLTRSGMTLQAFCKKLFRDLDHLQSAIDSPHDHPKWRLKIGTFPTLAIQIWPDLLESLEGRHDLRLSITTGRSGNILEGLIHGNIDLALTVGTTRHERIVSHDLFGDEYGFFTKKQDRQTALSVEDLRSRTLLYMPDSRDEDGNTLEQLIYSYGLRFQEKFELDSYEVITEFVRRGIGIGILPLKAATRHASILHPIRIAGIKKSFGPHRFFLSYLQTLDVPAAIIKSLLATIKESQKGAG